MNKVEQPHKFERVSVFEDCTVIWRYDRSKSSQTPYETEIKWNKNFLPTGPKRTKIKVKTTK
jgi:hypothetical protein